MKWEWAHGDAKRGRDVGATPASPPGALGWLLLATVAVAASSLFAVLIVLARVPALGSLFPGTEFYRVALTLHVDLSQWVWFMAFAGVLWSLRPSPAARWLDGPALALATAGALLMALSPALGPVRALTSNYLPVLDSPWFLAGLVLYAIAVFAKAAAALAGWHLPLPQAADRAGVATGLNAAAAVVIAALGLLATTAWLVGDRAGGAGDVAYHEVLFWGSGHVWQFCLTTLMVVAWLLLAPPGVDLPEVVMKGLLVAGVLPALAMAFLPALLDPLDPAYFAAFTALMRWFSWEVPLVVALLLCLSHWRRRVPPDPAFVLSLALLAIGICLGSAIRGQNTVVTAHYHGTIGAVTVAFMGASFRLLSFLTAGAPPAKAVRRQLSLYVYGILLMMAGLAGAGMMGAPRKMAGNVGADFGIEMASRVVMGLGGCLATAGILMFLVLIGQSLVPRVHAATHLR